MEHARAHNPLGDARSAPDWPQREAALIARIRDRGLADRDAWNELLLAHQDRLFAVCQRMVGPAAAADLTQDAMVKILQGLDGYDGRSQVGTWMVRVAMNACLSWLRSQKLRRHKGLGGSEESVRGLGTLGGARGQGGELSPLGRVQGDERNAALAAALADLPDDQRAIVVLRDVQGLDYEQIAECLEVAVGTVKSRLFRARMALRELVENRLGDLEAGGAGQSRP
ncbi:MAG: RNA polymerase sigma factor [Phycisphaeraceae bacterium]|nr:RNA polymerase sigma factor [Phycisphaeraceae bacterium]MBX3406989.1 RNA polymerase sigma factor [Phycisphaeraceae bacterium]